MATMLKFPLLFGAVRHMRLIGEDPKHKALRARNEARLAALKASHRLYEDKRESTSTGRNSLSEYNLSPQQLACAVGQQLAQLTACQLSSAPSDTYGYGSFGLGLSSADYWPGR